MAGKETLCVHSGTIKDRATGGILSPLYPSSSHRHLDVGEDVYPRHGNLPNQRAVVQKVCELEGSEHGLVFSSGMAAITSTFLCHLKKGDHLVLQRGTYSGALNFTKQHLHQYGVQYSVTDGCELRDFASKIKKNTKVVYLESPTNPILDIVDIAAIASLAKEHGLVTITDNTVATPINQNPISLGVDLVLHSATKFLGGHGDISGGVVVGAKDLVDPIAAYLNDFGGCMNPHTCHLLERSMRTLAIRMAKINENALELASQLSANEFVSRVFYPGLPEHPNHNIAKSQMSGYGGILSFEVNSSINLTNLQKRLKLILPANSLGDMETTLNSPFQASSSFTSLQPEEKKKSGVTEQLVRMSVGIEDVVDLGADLAQALTISAENKIDV